MVFNSSSFSLATVVNEKKNNRTENMLLSIELIGSLLNTALLLLALLYVRKALSEKFIAFSSFAREFALMYNIQLHTHLYCPKKLSIVVVFFVVQKFIK